MSRMVKCPNCEQRVEYGDFCPICGYKLGMVSDAAETKEDWTVTLKCPNAECNREYHDPELRLCPYCGTELVTKGKSIGKWKCEEGHINDDDNDYCIICGRKKTSIPEPPKPPKPPEPPKPPRPWIMKTPDEDDLKYKRYTEK